MAHALKLHPDSVCTAVDRIEVAVRRQASALRLSYVVYGDIAALTIPARAASNRRDQLWQHTCCEAFIRATDGADNATDQAYYELNFSPSTEWAAYRFGRYRADMLPVEIAVPTITITSDTERFELQCVLDGWLRTLPGKLSRMGVSAVIEEHNGNKSYWALQHPSGKPDFHHADGFIELEL